MDQWCCFGAFCWQICQLRAQSAFSSFFSGKSPAGPVCGITPKDPSKAGSQKRKQLSDNELLYFSGEWMRKLDCVKNTHTLLLVIQFAYVTCTCLYPESHENMAKARLLLLSELNVYLVSHATFHSNLNTSLIDRHTFMQTCWLKE